MLIAFFISYGQQSLHLPPAQLLFVCTLAAGAWLAFTLVGGFLGDKIGRVRTFQVGYIALALWAVPMFLLIDLKNILFFFIAAARFDDTARSDLRTTSRVVCGDVSSEGTLFWSVGRVRAWLDTGRSVRGDDSAVDRLDVWPVWPIGVYLVILSAISLIAVSVVKDPMGVDLNERRCTTIICANIPNSLLPIGVWREVETASFTRS